MKRSVTITIFTLSCLSVLSFPACQSVKPDLAETNANVASPKPEAANEQPPIDDSILARLRTEKWSGDIKGLVERRYIRALVLYNKTNFFYDGPQPRGVTYEALKEFEKFLNEKLNTGDKPLYMVFIPVTREEGLKRMSDGRGDIAASNIPITSELQQIVDFSDPVRSDVKEIVVTGPAAPEITTLDDLAGKEIFVRKVSRYWPSLERLNEQYKQTGKPAMILKEADANLEDEDILDMVNAGLVGITIMDDLVAGLWAKVYEGIKIRDDLEVAAGDKIGWVVQKNTPEFRQLINEFVAGHKVGTSFGNTVLQRYYKDAKWAKNNTRPEEMEKFKAAVAFFKKYGEQYDFDWLLIAAQAYQESGIDQSRRSAAGAVGVMQIKPSTAEDKTINISNVDSSIENNIHAGVKYMDYISNQYFEDAKMNKINRSLFAFASYNAGPARVVEFRKQAEAEGLDPNIWFNNVELIAAKKIGSETVTYVSNIYKYYVAYKMVQEDSSRKKRK